MISLQNLRDLCCDCPTGTYPKLLNLYRDKKVQIYKEKAKIIMNLIIRDSSCHQHPSEHLFRPFPIYLHK